MGTDPDSSPAADPNARLRWAIYVLLIALSVGQAAGKILAVNSVDLVRLEKSRIDAAVERQRDRLIADGFAGERLDEAVAAHRLAVEKRLRLQRPFLSANDRSRWLAIRAIAERGEPHIDTLLEEPTWDTIDMVKHVGRDGEEHLYSSKPPLLMVLIAAPYWVLIQLTGTTLGESPYLLGRTLLLGLNGGALALMLFAAARLIERFGSGDVDRIAAMAAASFGTMLSAFTPVLNNHLFAAAVTAVACDAWARSTNADNEAESRRAAALAGLTAALAAAFELPALSLLVLLGLSIAWDGGGRRLAWYAAPALLVVAASFGANYWTHGTFEPAYAHRGGEENWYDYEYTVRGKTRDSYWRNPQGIDQGEPSRAVYALHALVGHHGVFSLTPVWALSMLGMARLPASSRLDARRLAWITLAITAACLFFYIGMRPQGDRNYGGATSGFRWMFWVAPLWLALLPAGAKPLVRHRIGLAIVAALLAWSAVSASHPTWNPWRDPWLSQWLDYLQTPSGS